MEERALWLDGNAIAGLLAEVFGTEMTPVHRGCQACGEPHAVGEHRLYRGAGDVLRCPGCGAVGLRIATLPDRHVVVLSGTWSVAVPRE